MRLEGDVGLEAMVWMAQSDEATVARALAHAVQGSDWTLTMMDRRRVRWRGDTVEIEAPSGSAWGGLVVGRVHEQERPETPPEESTRDAFRPYALDAFGAPLRLESCWFAADLDGQVACFDRDALGAAPKKRCWGPRPAPAFEPYTAPALADALARRHARSLDATRHFAFVADARALVEAFRSHAPAEAARRWAVSFDRGRAIVSTTAGHGDEPLLAGEFLAWLHDASVCEGCARAPMRDPRIEGVFTYAHQGRARAVPYERVAEPSVAWTVDQAAARLGLSIEALRGSVLPLVFAAKPRLQPIEYAPCTWSETVPWESEAGVQHGARRLA